MPIFVLIWIKVDVYSQNFNYSTIVATDEKEQCKPPCKATTRKSGGAEPPWFQTGGAIAPPAPLVLMPVRQKHAGR